LENDWTKRIVKVPELFDSEANAYEQCVTAGPFIFVAGQAGWDKDDDAVPLEFEPQVRKTFENIRYALRAAGADLKDLVSMTVFLTDARYMREFLDLRKEILAGNYATSALITIDKLYDPTMLVEIQAIAVRPS
jgi:2-iminobutanoate/2-iminopropanoate deaminase